MAKGQRKSNREVRKPKQSAEEKRAKARPATVPEVMSQTTQGKHKPKR